MDLRPKGKARVRVKLEGYQSHLTRWAVPMGKTRVTCTAHRLESDVRGQLRYVIQALK